MRRRFRIALERHPGGATRGKLPAPRRAISCGGKRSGSGPGAILFYSPIGRGTGLCPRSDGRRCKPARQRRCRGFVSETGTYEAFEISRLNARLRAGKIRHFRTRLALRGHFPLNRLDLALAPGLGFDVSGRRLGRGQGFYDRLLAGIAGAKCGVAFDQQIVGANSGGGTRRTHEFYFDADTLAGNFQDRLQFKHEVPH